MGLNLQNALKNGVDRGNCGASAFGVSISANSPIKCIGVNVYILRADAPAKTKLEA